MGRRPCGRLAEGRGWWREWRCFHVGDSLIRRARWRPCTSTSTRRSHGAEHCRARVLSALACQNRGCEPLSYMMWERHQLRPGTPGAGSGLSVGGAAVGSSVTGPSRFLTGTGSPPACQQRARVVTWTSLCVVRVKLTELSVQPSMWMSGGGIPERTSKRRQGRGGRTERSSVEGRLFVTRLS